MLIIRRYQGWRSEYRLMGRLTEVIQTSRRHRRETSDIGRIGYHNFSLSQSLESTLSNSTHNCILCDLIYKLPLCENVKNARRTNAPQNFRSSTPHTVKDEEKRRSIRTVGIVPLLEMTVYNGLPLMKWLQGRASEGIPSGRGSFFDMHSEKSMAVFGSIIKGTPKSTALRRMR